MDESCIFFIKLPCLQQFCHIVMKIDNKTSKWPQTQILKCRQLLFLCRDVVACPNYYDITLLDVVMSMTYFKDKKIHPFCQKLGLQPIHASPAMLNILQECFTFTMRFKMSSTWNMISNFLVKGPEVVTCKEKQEAVDLDIVIADGQITLTVRPLLIRNPPPSIQNFDICFQALRNFEEDENMTIKEFSIYRSWCHILPSMKRGQLVRVSHKIPFQTNSDSSPTSFTDYAGLKKYWKNHHGIRLPEDETGMIYGSIYFKLIGHQLFTYPLCCLRTKEIQVMPRCDGPAIIKDFMTCLHQKVDKLCGFKLVYSSKPCYATSNLSGAVQVKPGKLQNVTMSDNTRKNLPPPPTRPQISNANSSQTSRRDIIPSSQQVSSESNAKDKVEVKNEYSASQVIPSSQAVNKSTEKQKNDAISKVRKQMPTNVNGKFIPVFKTKTKTTNNCARKLEVDISKKKSSFKKSTSIATSTPKQAVSKGKTNLGIVTSVAAGGKYKTPKTLSHNLDDSGYDSNMTPQNVETQDKMIAKKYQPKKLSFDHILNSTLNKSWASKKQQRSPLKIMKNHAFDTMFTKATKDAQSPAPGSNTKYSFEARSSVVDPGKPVSPLNIMKNHSFDKFFSKAGMSNSNQKGSNMGCYSKSAHNDSGFSSSPLKTIKNHSFNQLFRPANDLDVDDVIPSSNNGQQGQRRDHSMTLDINSILARKNNEGSSSKITAQNHSFDKLFASAGAVHPSLDLKDTSISELSKFEKRQEIIRLNGNHSFDQLFTSASKILPPTREMNRFENVAIMRMPPQCESSSVQMKKHSIDELSKSADAKVLQVQSCLDANSANGMVLFQTADSTRKCVQRHRSRQKDMQTAIQATKVAKRKLLPVNDRDSPNIVKKPRVDQSINIEDMAKADKLSKVNAPTLASWLKSRGISVKSRDKKEDLVAKVKLQVMLKGGAFRGIDD